MELPPFFGEHTRKKLSKETDSEIKVTGSLRYPSPFPHCYGLGFSRF